jgi:geranylgeranyl transferase type-2 subunit alpha
LTSKALKKNPEFYTIWNHRRLILLHRFSTAVAQVSGEDDAPTAPSQSFTQDAIVNDLRFIVPLLMQYPKCYWIWNYRQWLLEEAEQRLEKPVARGLWEEELGLVGKMLTRDERNFHGWGYRRFVVDKLEALRTPKEGTLVEQEFLYTEKMIKAKLQNFSALHYRSKLLPRLLTERKADGVARRQMLQQELDNMQDALIDPFNQSAWFYHQFLISSLGDELSQEHRIVQDLSIREQLDILEQELDRIKEIEEDFDDCKWVYEALIMYTLVYSKLEGSDLSRKDGLSDWIQKLYNLDPMRKGRWNELKSATSTSSA